MPVRIYNTMTRSKEEFVPREAGKVAMYVCGPTVYNYIHVGNARTFLVFDMIRRYLEHRGFDVTFIQNITDVDDKIINKANEEGVEAPALADGYREAFEEDMAALGVKPPDLAPRATEHIGDMVEVIACLIDKGFAYEADGDVYFNVERFEPYGRLSGRNLDEQQSTPAVGHEAERKRGPWDFALWKAAKPGEPSWDSPWGAGRPGWHIECSTMSAKYLGEGFDIHGGGLDLVFPHHENEIAQAEACSGQRFVRYWIHSGMLNIDLEKMSKSLGNIKLLREVLDKHDAQTVRMLMLGTHYRSPLHFSDESLADARAQVKRLTECWWSIDQELAGTHETERSEWSSTDWFLYQLLRQARREFHEQMEDDFNTAAAMGILFTAVREINSYIALQRSSSVRPVGLVLRNSKKALAEMFKAVGLFQRGKKTSVPDRPVTRTAGISARARISNPSLEHPNRQETLALWHQLTCDSSEVLRSHEPETREEAIDAVLEIRQEAREMKNFELADRIRDGLAELGVRVEDVRDGFRWRIDR